MAKEPYKPIDCDFHDELEAAATLRKEVALVIRDEHGGETPVRGVIVDLGHGEEHGLKGEYMTLRDGLRVRLDRIVSIDGKPRPI